MLLFGGRPPGPSFALRTLAFLGKDECLPEPPPEGEYVVSAEEREAILAAFRETFTGGKSVPTEDGYYLSGHVSVEATSATKAWNGAAGAVFDRLRRNATVRDANEALKALDFLYLEVIEEGFEDVVARALSEAEQADGRPTG